MAENRTLIFYDQRGGGLSDLPADTTLLGAEQMVADLEAVRRFFELERMTLIAHSFVSILSQRGLAIEEITRLMGHAGTAVTELVYRHELRPVLEAGASVMDSVFPVLSADQKSDDDDAA